MHHAEVALRVRCGVEGMCEALSPPSNCGSCAHMVDEEGERVVHRDKYCSGEAGPCMAEDVHVTQQMSLSPTMAPEEESFPCAVCSCLVEDTLDGVEVELGEED